MSFSYLKFKSLPWSVFVGYLAAANVLTIGLTVFLLLNALFGSKEGDAGLGIYFAVLFLQGPSSIIASVNIVSVILYLKKHTPSKKLMWFNIAVVLLSVAYLAYFMRFWY